MNESATEVPTGKEEKPIAPQQLREFDSRLLQQLPVLSKFEMQHLIEHPEEMRARLRTFGLGNIAVTSAYTLHEGRNSSKTYWSHFYADVFGVAPDFSRVSIPENQIFTYTTPIFVAPKLHLMLLLDAFKQFGVELRIPEHLDTLKFGPLDADTRPSSDNYVIAISDTIMEEVCLDRRKDARYCNARMTLHEYLLWTLFCLYRAPKAPHEGRCDLQEHAQKPNPPLCFFPATTYGTTGGIAVLDLRTFTGEIRLDVFPENETKVYREATVRRVKLWKSLRQI